MPGIREFRMIMERIDRLEKEIMEIKYAVLPTEKIDKKLAEELRKIEERMRSGEFASEKEIFEALSE